jgi:hypothetical protein
MDTSSLKNVGKSQPIQDFDSHTYVPEMVQIEPRVCGHLLRHAVIERLGVAPDHAPGAGVDEARMTVAHSGHARVEDTSPASTTATSTSEPPWS